MPVKFKAVAKKNPLNPTAAPQYYARNLNSGEVNLRELADEAADISTLSAIDLMGGIEALLKLVPRHLVKSESVRLGDFGIFNLRMKSSGSATADEVTATNITQIKVQFIPGKLFKDLLKTAHFEKQTA